nr:exported hypothetical protein [Xanthomonas citri pv. citri]
MLLHFCRRATALLGLGLALVPLTPAQATDATPDTLEKVVILKRHGVRAAMSSPERLGRYSLHPWPHFGVPAGHLTANGAQLERLFGDYYRAHYTALGLLNGDGCNQAYYWANRTQRTIASAQALASTLTPGCADPVHHVPTGSSDVLFDGTAALRCASPRRVRACRRPLPAASVAMRRLGMRPRAMRSIRSNTCCCNARNGRVPRRPRPASCA